MWGVMLLGDYIHFVSRSIMCWFSVSNSYWYISNWFCFIAFCLFWNASCIFENFVQSYFNSLLAYSFIYVISRVISCWDVSMKLMFLTATIFFGRNFLASWLFSLHAHFSIFVWSVLAFLGPPGFSGENQFLYVWFCIVLRKYNQYILESVCSLPHALVEGLSWPFPDTPGILFTTGIRSYSESKRFPLSICKQVFCFLTVGEALLQLLSLGVELEDDISRSHFQEWSPIDLPFHVATLFSFHFFSPDEFNLFLGISMFV